MLSVWYLSLSVCTCAVSGGVCISLVIVLLGLKGRVKGEASCIFTWVFGDIGILSKLKKRQFSLKERNWDAPPPQLFNCQRLRKFLQLHV